MDVRLLPQDIAAEQAVLGSLLLDDDALWRIRGSLDPEAFWLPKHRLLYRTICRLAEDFEDPTPLNTVSVAYALGEEALDQIGGPGYLGELVASVPTTVHLEHYAQIVRETAQRRALIGHSAKLAQGAFEGRPLAELQAETLALFSGLESRTGGFRSLAEIRERHRATLDVDEARPGIRGHSTGFPRLDNLTRGLKPGELWIVGARPSMGKSAWALNVARHVAARHGPVGVFSLEMDEESLYERLRAERAGFNVVEAECRGWTPEEKQAARQADQYLAGLPLWIDETAGLDTATMRSRVQRLAAEHPDLALIVVDYLNLVGDPGDSEVQRLSQATRALRDLGRSFGLPVVLVCQLNREPDKRQNKRPTLTDLRDSGGIEQHADIVILLYRDDYYSRPTVPTKVLEIILAKQRKGPTGDIKARYDLETGRMGELMP